MFTHKLTCWQSLLSYSLRVDVLVSSQRHPPQKFSLCIISISKAAQGRKEYDEVVQSFSLNSSPSLQEQPKNGLHVILCILVQLQQLSSESES